MSHKKNNTLIKLNKAIKTNKKSDINDLKKLNINQNFTKQVNLE